MKIQKNNKQPNFCANLNIKSLNGTSDITNKEFDLLKKMSREIGTLKDDIFVFINHKAINSELKDSRYVQDTVIVSNIGDRLNSANLYTSSPSKRSTFDFIRDYIISLI